MDRSLRILVFIGGKVHILKLSLPEYTEEKVAAFLEDVKSILTSLEFYGEAKISYEDWERGHEAVWGEVSGQLTSGFLRSGPSR